MSINPYLNPEIALHHGRFQADPARNRYDWEVTQPGLLQFLDDDVNHVIDYGCGTGTLIIDMAAAARRSLHKRIDFVGADASPSMLSFAAKLKARANFAEVSFHQWDATEQSPTFLRQKTQRIFAKFVLDYISADELAQSVFPQFRNILDDKGLVVAVVANHTDPEADVQIHHHEPDDIFTAANVAGFTFGSRLALPFVRFEPYQQKEMRIANPMPLESYTNTAKDWIYVLGASEQAQPVYHQARSQFINWRQRFFPEIADSVDMIPEMKHADGYFPLDRVIRQAFYQYRNPATSDRKLVLDGTIAEHLSPEQKVKIASELGRHGIRPPFRIEDHLTRAAS